MSEPRRRRGRPPLVAGDIPARVHVTVPSKDYDKADQIAKREGISVPAIVRTAVRRYLEDDESDDDD